LHSLNVVASSVPGQPWTCEPSTLPNLQNVELRMIDVTHQCIVPASPGYQYVALSYVWASKSKEDRLVLNKQTYPRLVETGGLAAHKVDVPQTFRDAITLVNRLGLKYLWIDALCIQQDDPAVLEAQMSYMDQIYGCAILTLVCNTTSSDSGLPGVRPNIREVNQWQYMNTSHSPPQDVLHGPNQRYPLCQLEAGRYKRISYPRGSCLHSTPSFLQLPFSHICRAHNPRPPAAHSFLPWVH
jgi:hypothetical protein